MEHLDIRMCAKKKKNLFSVQLPTLSFLDSYSALPPPLKKKKVFLAVKPVGHTSHTCLKQIKYIEGKHVLETRKEKKKKTKH